MAATTITYRGLSGVRATINVDTTDTLTSICSDAIADEGLNANYYADFFLLRDNSVLRSTDGASTYTALGLSTTDELVAVLDDDPATWTKEQRQIRKLEIASIKRAADGRPSTYDVTQIPNPYEGNSVNPDDDENTDALVVGRPWT
jgi:hypothetical protein